MHRWISFDVLAAAYERLACVRVPCARGFVAFEAREAAKAIIIGPPAHGLVNRDLAVRAAQEKFGKAFATLLDDAIDEIEKGACGPPS